MSRCILNQVVDEAHDGKAIGDAQKMTAPILMLLKGK